MKRFLGCLALTLACTEKPPAEQASWQTVMEGEEINPLLAAWGSGNDHMVFVGGSVGNGGEALVYQWDGAHLTQLHPGGTDTLWWVHGSSREDVWMVGEHGRLVHFDGTAFVEHPRVVDTTLWAVLAFSPTDVWAVGGMPGRPMGAPNDVVLHFDGSAWTQQVLPGTPRNVALLKLWGTAGDNLYVVGEQGTLWHHTSTEWVLESAQYDPPLADMTLFAVNGCSATEIYAAGGTRVLKGDGTRWEKMTVSGVTFANGLSCGQGGLTIVGFSGLKIRVKDGNVTNDTARAPNMNLHAAWTTPDGTVWVVGGDWLSQPQAGAGRQGVIGRYGLGTVTADVVR